jgi:hypothetical protein
MSRRDVLRRTARRAQPLSHQTREGFRRHPRGVVDHARALLRRLLIRTALLVAGCAALIIALGINRNAGHEILSGLLAPDDPQTIVVSVARLLAPVLGLWLIYRGLR